jgi:hypothetical protein
VQVFQSAEPILRGLFREEVEKDLASRKERPDISFWNRTE